AAASKIARKVRLKFVVEDGELALVELANGGNVGGIDDLSASMLHLADKRVHELVNRIVEAEIFAHHSQARAFQSRGIEELCVVGGELALTVSGCGVLRIPPCHGTEKNGDIPHGASHRTRRVLTVRDRNDAAATDKPNRRFKPCQTVHTRRTDDRPVRLRAHTGNAEIRGDSSSRPGARSTRIAVESIRVT